MKNAAGFRLKALAANNIKAKAMQHRAPAAPRAPRVNPPPPPPPPPPPLLRQDQQQHFSAPSHQISDDPYAFHPSDFAGHAFPTQQEQEDVFNDQLESPLEEEEGGSGMEDDIEQEEEEQASPSAEESLSDWEPSSENDDEVEVEEETPAPPPAQTKVVTMVRKTTTNTAATATATVTNKKGGTVLSGPDSSFAVFLSSRGTYTSTNGATTSKLPSSITIQQKLTGGNGTAAAVAAVASPIATASADANPMIKKKKKKLTFADQAELPIMIPKSVAREPAGTAIIIELPQGVELAGASGVIGRIIGGGGVGGKEVDSESESESGSAGEAEPKSGVILDLMGIQYATEVFQLPSSLAIAHLTGDRLIVDSILTTAVRAAAVPGQHGLDPGTGTGNESVYSMQFDSDQSDYDDTFGGGGTNTSNARKKKARGGTGEGAGAKKTRKKPAARKSGGGVRKPRALTGAITKKRAATKLQE